MNMPQKISAWMPSDEAPIVGPFHALIGGKPQRIFPATGNPVSLEDLGGSVKWVGDSIGLSLSPLITVADDAGAWAEASPEMLLCSPIWRRMDSESRQRIRDGLQGAKCYEVRVFGHDMQPRIKPGECAAPDFSRSPAVGDDVIVWMKTGRIMVKELRAISGDSVRLGSCRDVLPPLEVSKDRIASIFPVGEIRCAPAS